MIRSVRSSWPSTGPSRETSASNARGQSSSVPISNPIRCSAISCNPPRSWEPWQMMRDLASPRRPVVRDVVAPEVDLAGDALLVEQRAEAPRRVERAGRVLPLPLSADEQDRDVIPQPAQVVAAQVRDVVHRVVEVDGIALLAPALNRDVVHAAHADREREEVGPLEAEVGRVVGPE